LFFTYLKKPIRPFVFDIIFQGIVAAVKDGFGFIKRDKSSRRDHHDSRMFFHSSELLDKSAVSGRRRIKMGDEVEFTGLVKNLGFLRSNSGFSENLVIF